MDAGDHHPGRQAARLSSHYRRGHGAPAGSAHPARRPLPPLHSAHSAALALNERIEPEVRADIETFLDRLAPEAARYTHAYEGPDDMPAHLKALLVGSSVTIPVTAGQLNLGTWQGLYLCEFRNHGGPRRLVATVWGEGAT